MHIEIKKAQLIFAFRATNSLVFPKQFLNGILNFEFWFNVLGAGQRAFKKMNVEGGKEAAKLLKRVSNEPPVAVHLLKVAESLKLFHLSQFL